eukprot:CFRG3512T1
MAKMWKEANNVKRAEVAADTLSRMVGDYNINPLSPKELSPEMRKTLVTLLHTMRQAEFEQAADFLIDNLGTTQKGYIHQRLSQYTSRDFISLLPTEASYLIFSHLDFQSLLACSHVNKLWHRLSSDSRLWRKLWAKMGWKIESNDLNRLIHQSQLVHPHSQAHGYTLAQSLDTYDNEKSLVLCNSLNNSGRTIGDDAVEEEVKLCEGHNTHGTGGSDGSLLSSISLPLTSAASWGGDGWRQMFISRLLLNNRWLRGDYVTHSLQGHEASVNTVVFGSRVIVTGSDDCTARVWDLRTGLEVAKLHGHENIVTCVRLYENADTAKITPGLHAEVLRHAQLRTRTSPQQAQNLRTTLVLTGSWDGTVKLWSVPNAQCAGGRNIGTANGMGMSVDQNVSAALCLFTFNEHVGSAVLTMAYNKGKYFLTGSLDNCIRVFDIKEQRLRRTLRGHTDTVLCVQFDTTHIVSGSEDCTIMVWDVPTLTATHTLTGHEGAVTACMFDSKWMVSTSVDRSIRIWQKSDWSVARIINNAHQAAIHTLQFGMGRMVTGAGNDSIKIWDFDTGNCLHILEEHSSHINCLAYNHQVILSCSGDRVVKIINFGNPDCEFSPVASAVPWKLHTRAKSLSGTFPVDLAGSHPHVESI